MKRSLEAAIPVGTSASVAAARLPERGFKVALQRDSLFVEDDHVREHADFLYGNRMDGCIVKREWMVIAVLHEESVSKIQVNTERVGP
jgi:hypothetical protein